MGNEISGLCDALQADFDAAKKRGVSAATVNLAFGHSEGSSWAYQVCEGHASFPLTQVHAWLRVTGGAYLLRWLAAQARCVVVTRPDASVTLHDAHAATVAFSRLLGEIARDTAPSSPGGAALAPAEAKLVHARAMAAASAILAVAERARRQIAPTTRRVLPSHNEAPHEEPETDSAPAPHRGAF